MVFLVNINMDLAEPVTRLDMSTTVVLLYLLDRDFIPHHIDLKQFFFVVSSFCKHWNFSQNFKFISNL